MEVATKAVKCRANQNNTAVATITSPQLTVPIKKDVASIRYTDAVPITFSAPEDLISKVVDVSIHLTVVALITTQQLEVIITKVVVVNTPHMDVALTNTHQQLDQTFKVARAIHSNLVVALMESQQQKDLNIWVADVKTRNSVVARMERPLLMVLIKPDADAKLRGLDVVLMGLMKRKGRSLKVVRIFLSILAVSKFRIYSKSWEFCVIYFEFFGAEACRREKNRGSCRDFTVKWFYDMEYGGCSRFWYGGCDGNDNRFKSQDECKRTCVAPEGKGNKNNEEVNHV